MTDTTQLALDVVAVPPEWVCSGALRLEEHAGRLPKTDASVSLYVKGMGPERLKQVIADGTVLRLRIRGVAIELPICTVRARGFQGDLLVLHGPCTLV